MPVRLTRQLFIEKASMVHTKYDYTLVEYINTTTKVKIKCPTHGIFEQIPKSHMRGAGCPLCAGNKQSTSSDFIHKANHIHKDVYDYSLVTYTRALSKVKIICKKHGVFTKTPAHHLDGQGCPKCARQRTFAYTTSSLAEFIAKAQIIHGDTYDYSLVQYKNNKTDIEIICPEHGIFTQRPDAHMYQRQGCPKCSNLISKGEQELFDWLTQEGFAPEQSNRTILNGKEIDIYLPEHKLGIEYNGLYFHSDSKNRGGVYHKNKTKAAEKAGLHLMQFWDIEWESQKDIVKSIILNKLNKPKHRYFARKLQVKEVQTKQARSFCVDNHIHGFRAASLYQGLWDGVDLIALMSCAKDGEMVRFVVKKFTQVVGGFSRLLKYCPIKYSFVDRRIFQGTGYKTLGFISVNWTYPNYFYTQDYSSLESRQKYQKHKLHKLLPDFNSDLSETINMFQNGFDRIFDCGHEKYILP